MSKVLFLPNKCTRGNGRKDVFDHILSKEIFDSGSSLPLFLSLSVFQHSDFILDVWMSVKRLPNAGTDQQRWLKSLEKFCQFSVGTIYDRALSARFTVTVFFPLFFPNQTSITDALAQCQ